MDDWMAVVPYLGLPFEWWPDPSNIAAYIPVKKSNQACSTLGLYSAPRRSSAIYYYISVTHPLDYWGHLPTVGLSFETSGPELRGGTGDLTWLVCNDSQHSIIGAAH